MITLGDFLMIKFRKTWAQFRKNEKNLSCKIYTTHAKQNKKTLGIVL